jgi:hypothetical protein
MPQAHALLMLIVCGLLASGCGGGTLSTQELVAALDKQGISVESGDATKTQVQNELDNLNDAFASGVPIPRLAKKLKLDGVPADIFFCPGKAQQVKLVVERLLRGPSTSDPPHLEMAAGAITGDLNLPFETHIVSLRPKREDDDAVLRIALALAEIEAR